MRTEYSTVTVFENDIMINAGASTAGTFKENPRPFVAINNVVVDIRK